MSPLELLRRHTARVTSTFLQRLRSGELQPHESLQLARRAIATAPQLAIVDATRCAAPPAYLLDCMHIVRGDEPHFLLVVDSAQSWAEAMNTGSSEYETLNAGLAALRNLAHSLNCPVLAISERNRESMSSGGMSAGAGSRKIEYGAEAIIDLGREADARPDLTGEVPVKLRLAKNRHGAPGKSVVLSFNGALQRFKAV
jgi:replicative DNA helicase